MSKIARVKFIRDKEPNIKALTAENKVLDGALYVATDTGTMWMGTSATSLIQIKDNINTNTTYTLTKSGNTITLKGSDGSSVNITDSNTIYNNATASAAGLMSAADKSKLDSVATGANKTVVDASFVDNSTNPVQSKVIKSALDGKSDTGHTHDDRYYTESEINTKLNAKANSSHTHTKSQITDFPTSMPASDVSAWAKAATKPSYSKAEVGLGNVDNTADSAKSVKYASSAGSATTAATANALKVTELTTQNLDNTKTVGLYFAGGSNSVKNKPTGVDAFGLEVKKTASGYLVQVLTEGNTNAMKTWIRQCNYSSAWSAWAYYFDSNHTPAWSQVSGKPSFATVATSGSYNDLSNKPTIPTIPSALKNPNALTISLNGTSQGAYDGSAAKSINVTPSSIGAAPSSHSHSYLPLSGGTVSGNVHFSSIGDKAKSAGITWDGSTDGASIYYETRGPGLGHLVLNMIDDSSVTVDIAAGGAVQSYFGYDGTFHGNVAGNASSASSVAWSNVSGRPSSMPASDVYSWAKASSKPSYSWSEISNKPTIPSVGNGTITITQNGTTKGSFTLNQSGNATIALTDNDTNTWRPEEVIISSTQPSANTCKLWIKI